ncbi:MAG TPA: DUF4390 domain-containing protein [Thermoanaerobaculia bacterium]|nr:DUF4390 domain-containing protein [Thermoanaerobaculia bacterium]
MRRTLFILLAFLTASAHADDARIENLAAAAANGQVSVRFSLTNAFRNGQTVQGLQSGVPTSFTYIIEIFRDRPNWFDEGIDRSRIEVIATFNSVTREYLLNYRRDRKLVRSETFSDLEALERRMTTIDEPALFDIGKRRPYKLKVRVKADLSRGWMLYVIPWQVSTRWKEARVAAPPEVGVR